jgi:tRNA(Ile)-lysidine synthase
MPSLPATVRATVARHRLLASGDHVVVAVSGGPDSVALLHALTGLRADYGLALTVGHVHHGLRADADRDAALVTDLAARLGWPATVERVAVAGRPGRSPETAARAARYAALDRIARRAGATRIALAHTADDQAETVLMRLLQGAGPRGLAGIPVRRGRLVRPLLEVDRAAVLAYLADTGLDWVEDETNRDPKLLRNRIRHETLPLLAAHGWPRIGEALRRTAGASREAVEALDALVAPRVAGLVRPGLGGTALELAGLRDLPPGALKAALRLALVDVLGRPEVRAGLRAAHLDRLAALVPGPVGARVRLPAGLAVERARDALWVTAPGRRFGPVTVAVPGETCLAGLGRLHVRRDPPSRDGRSSDPHAECFDEARLPGPLTVRPRRPGDRFVPFGSDRPVRVARALAAAAVPASARRGWPLLVAGGAAGETVLWVIGVRRAAVAPITVDSTHVLEVRMSPDPIVRPREVVT